MVELAHIERVTPLKDRVGGAAGVSLVASTPTNRVSLRADRADAAALSEVLGLDLPMTPKTSASNGKGRLACWLGPDEWLILDEAGDPMVDLAKAEVLHCAVDISHRNSAILVSGEGARATLAAGCPQNLNADVFPVGAVSRTVLGKIEVVIMRRADTEFRVECWRSFCDYAFDFLADAARDCLA